MLFRSQQLWNVAPYALTAHFPIKIGVVLFIVKWEICSNYCNSIVGKISRAWLTFFFLSVLVRKSTILTPTAVYQLSSVLDMIPLSPILITRRLQDVSETQCTEMEPPVIVIREKKDRFPELQRGQPGRVSVLFDMQEAASHRKTLSRRLWLSPYHFST